MADLEFGEHLKVKENAMVAISQIRDQLEDAVIAIVDHPPDSCCVGQDLYGRVHRIKLPLPRLTPIVRGDCCWAAVC